MMTEKEYMKLRSRLHEVLDEIKEAKKDLISQFMASEYPGVDFVVSTEVDPLRINIDLLDVSLAEVRVVSEEISKYLRNLDQRGKEYVS